MSDMTDKTQIVVDTNIWIAAAFNSGSNSARIVNGLQDARWRLRWDDITRRESKHIIETIYPIREQWAQRFAPLFKEANKHTGTITDDDKAAYAQVSGNLDRHFAALAAATGAVLITNDKGDLLSVKDQLDIYVLRPSVFCRKFACPPHS